MAVQASAWASANPFANGSDSASMSKASSTADPLSESTSRASEPSPLAPEPSQPTGNGMDSKKSAEKRKMLRRYYLARLGSKHAELLEWQAKIGGADLSADPPADGVSLDDLRAYAHKIKGAAGSFGFPEIGFAAAELEAAEPTALAGRLGLLLERVEAALGTAEDEEPGPGDSAEPDTEGKHRPLGSTTFSEK